MHGTGGRVNRKVTRFDLDRRVRVVMSGAGASAVLHGRTCDISEAGMCALISGALKVADKVVLEMSGLEEGILALDATVRHARGFYYGFEFDRMDRKRAALLVKFMTRNATPKLRGKADPAHEKTP